MKLPQDLDKFITLYLYDELSDNEKREFVTHLEFNEKSRNRLAEFRSVHNLLKQKAVPKPSRAILEHSRLALQRRLQSEDQPALLEIWLSRLANAFHRPAFSQLATAVVLLLLGLFIGKFGLGNGDHRAPQLTIPGLGTDISPISNVDLVEYDPQLGIVTVHYKTVQDVVLKGHINNPEIKRVLVHTIRRETHPGRRLTAVSASIAGSDSDVILRRALLFAMAHDEIDGVRLRAAKALKQLPLTDDIQFAFIQVLIKDPNPAMRILAVEALSTSEQEDVFSVFFSASKSDKNEFVRLQTSRILERRKD